MPDFTRDETMDDVLSEVARESGEPERPTGDPEVPVGAHVRAFRETMGMSVQQFAERTGFSSALLAQIENRMVSPSLGTLVKIANTFGTTVSSFIGGKEEREFSIVRKEDRSTISRVGLKEGGKSTYTYESLGAGKAGRKMEPFLVRLQPLSGPSTDLKRPRRGGVSLRPLREGDGPPREPLRRSRGGGLHLLQFDDPSSSPFRGRTGGDHPRGDPRGGVAGCSGGGSSWKRSGSRPALLPAPPCRDPLESRHRRESRRLRSAIL